MLYDTFNWYEVNDHDITDNFGVDFPHLLRIWRRVIYKPFSTIKSNTQNKKSRAIPIRLGFTQEGILRSDECLQGNSQIVMCIAC